MRPGRPGCWTVMPQLAVHNACAALIKEVMVTETAIAKDDVLQVGKKLQINVADEIVIKTGDATISMKKNGDITIKGKNITLNGSDKINVKASSNVVLKGSKISQN